MRTIVVGLGVQGPKRIAAASADVVATVDTLRPADFRDLRDVSLDLYDAALLCVPDAPKLELLKHLVANGKHALVEKPLAASDMELCALEDSARKTGSIVYTAYNHRFEPHFVRMRDLVASGSLGRIYRARMFYGNGTARLVRESLWRDAGAGVLPDLASHLLDTAEYWFGRNLATFKVASARCFENRSADHVVVQADGDISIELEMTLLSWRNHFVAEIYGERGQATISSLCKWGPSVFTVYDRVLPSGRPPENSITVTMPDPTWELEYRHFCNLCTSGATIDLSKDRWIGEQIRALSAEVVRQTAQ
ncbi:MAG: Gfo/Idh/MocA family oxidoreductase [Telmatospirillum sp.]|nr:Gfo/Idh/MocA family oxidoreductase [Telmatospirillum sp.]